MLVAKRKSTRRTTAKKDLNEEVTQQKVATRASKRLREANDEELAQEPKKPRGRKAVQQQKKDEPENEPPKEAPKRATRGRKKVAEEGNDMKAEAQPPAKKAPARGGKKNVKKEVESAAVKEEEVKSNAASSKSVADGTIPLDYVLARLVSPRSVVVGEYGAVLNQCNIGGNNNKAYHIYVVKDGNAYACFTRWNRVGEAGDFKLDWRKTLNEAIAEFKKKFKAKTGNDWNKRDKFVKKANKYELLEMDYTPKVETKNIKQEVKPTSSNIPPCKLEENVQDFVEMIFSADMFKNSMADIGIDVNRMPLGSLSKQQVQRAYDILKEIEDELKGRSRRSVLVQLSSSFYTRFPHSTGRTAPPVIDNLEMLQRKYDLVAVVSDIEEAQGMVKEVDNKVDVHPLDAKFDTLQIKLKMVSDSSDTYKMIKNYVTKSSPQNFFKKTLKVFEVSRNGEENRFEEHNNLTNRKLLWHGTNVAVVAAILKSGLRIMPHSGGRVGRGIYLASEHSKSLGYTSGTNWKGKHKSVMFLAEAALGEECEITIDDSSLKKAPKGYDSVVARGRQSPVGSGDMKIELDGREVIVPVGSVKDTKVSSRFHQDEYLIYKESQHRLRYVICFQ